MNTKNESTPSSCSRMWNQFNYSSGKDHAPEKSLSAKHDESHKQYTVYSLSHLNELFSAVLFYIISL